MKIDGGRVATACVALALLLGAAACGAQEETGAPLISMSHFSFSPSEITVQAGSEATLRVRNTETFWGDPHGWTLMEAGYRVEAPWTQEDQQHVLAEIIVRPGETEALTFSAPTEPGEYQFVCSVPEHLEAGMQGKLIVTQ